MAKGIEQNIILAHSDPKLKLSGVAVLSKKGIDIDPFNKIKDEEGKTLFLTFLYEKQIFQINICPNKPFFKKKKKITKTFHNT